MEPDGELSPTPDWRSVLAAGAVTAAPTLLGATLVSDVGGEQVAVRITEVEAYREDDPASHSFRGRTPRNEVMFGPPGRLYLYFVYGMHWAANVSCGADGAGEAVLVRAGAVVAGHAAARRRRSSARREVDLARGPGRLAAAMGLDATLRGTDLLRPGSPVVLRGALGSVPAACGPRVGIAVGTELRWRWWVPGDPTVSAFRPGRSRTAARPCADTPES